MQTDELYQLYLKHPSIETDTRKITPGCIFFALKGPNFNGNHFVKQALTAGAAFCVTDEDSGINDKRILRCSNSLEALQLLAKKHREQFSIPFIAITGSNGKTTTKELLYAVLSSQYRCSTTEGNLNNHIGIPLTLLKIKRDAEIAVIEMGANHQKEIEGYCVYTQPTHGLITNCGKAHLEGFGGEEGVRKGKGELFDYLRSNNGVAFIFNDYDYLVEMSKGISKIISYGTGQANYSAAAKDNNGFIELEVTEGVQIPSIKTKLVGLYNLPNVLAAVCVGKTFHVPEASIKEALENYAPSNSRSQMLEKDGNKIILDAYNANPSSMKLAIENFAKMPGQKVLVLGSMMELGDAADKEHQMIVELIKKHFWSAVALTGPGYTNVPDGFMHFSNVSETAAWYKQQHFNKVSVLIKGSRSMQMEKVLE